MGDRDREVCKTLSWHILHVCTLSHTHTHTHTHTQPTLSERCNRTSCYLQFPSCSLFCPSSSHHLSCPHPFLFPSFPSSLWCFFFFFWWLSSPRPASTSPPRLSFSPTSSSVPSLRQHTHIECLKCHLSADLVPLTIIRLDFTSVWLVPDKTLFAHLSSSPPSPPSLCSTSIPPFTSPPPLRSLYPTQSWWECVNPNQHFW